MKDFTDVHAELEAAAAMLYMVSNPLIEGDNRATDQTIGEALHGIACLIEHISEDLDEIEKGAQT